MFTVLDDCPDWPMNRVISAGHWTQGIAETFSDPQTGEATHLHFYCSREKARALWREIRHLIEKDPVKSVSFTKPVLPWTVMLWVPKGELRVVGTYDELPAKEFDFLPEHASGKLPTFATEGEAWAFIDEKYPHLHP